MAIYNEDAGKAAEPTLKRRGLASKVTGIALLRATAFWGKAKRRKDVNLLTTTPKAFANFSPGVGFATLGQKKTERGLTLEALANRRGLKLVNALGR